VTRSKDIKAPENPYQPPASARAGDAVPRRVYRDAEDELLDNNTAVRIFGVIGLMIGLSLAYLAVYEPLSAAQAGKQTLTLRGGAVAASFAAIVCGAIMLVAGKHTRVMLMHRWYNVTPLNFFCTLVLVGGAIAAESYFEHLLSMLGYVIN
jgi:hypothetical protein